MITDSGRTEAGKFTELTAAGTVADLHGIPFYPINGPVFRVKDKRLLFCIL
jgi:hypothetical protein